MGLCVAGAAMNVVVAMEMVVAARKIWEGWDLIKRGSARPRLAPARAGAPPVVPAASHGTPPYRSGCQPCTR